MTILYRHTKQTKSSSAYRFYSGIVKTVLPDRPAYHPHRSCVAVGVLCASTTCPMCTAVSLSLCDWLKVHIFHFVFVVLICTPHHTVNAPTIHDMMCLSTVTMSQCHSVNTGENTKEQETIIFTLFTLPDDLRYDVVIVVRPETVIFVATQRHITEGTFVWCFHCPSPCRLVAILWALATHFGPALNLHQSVMLDGGNCNWGFWHRSAAARRMFPAGETSTELLGDVNAEPQVVVRLLRHRVVRWPFPGEVGLHYA